MDPLLTLSASTRQTAGILLLAIVTIEWGGWAVLGLVRGQRPATTFQMNFARAGHAHAGVLVSLALICQLFVDATRLDGPLEFIARTGVPLAAILFPLGFFLSSMGTGATAPNRLIGLLYLGVVSLALGVVALGYGLLVA